MTRFLAICWRKILILLLVASSGHAVPMARSEEMPTQGRALAGPGAVLSQRQRVEPVNASLEKRLEEILPGLMRDAGLDMWLVINREYAEDPAYFSLVPQPSFAARRTTILVFFDPGQGEALERLTVSRYPFSGLYEAAWEGGNLEEQWIRLAELVDERDPKRIGINTSRHWPVADGLTASLNRRLIDALGPELSGRLVSAEKLVIRWLETRSELELQRYPHIVSLARGVIAEAFSEKVITPGVTTTKDVAWYIRERFSELELPIWFMPDVNLQRPGLECKPDSPFCGDEDAVILRGDVLHTDVGICYLGLCTDTQEMGYVAKLGEVEVPAGLAEALAIGNRWQDLLTAEFKIGRTGNEVLTAARDAAEREEIVASIYTHPLGVFGHAPGPTIGMWDNQGFTPVRGEWPLYGNTAYAIEGNIKAAVPEWDGQLVQIKLEQSAVFDGKTVYYLAGRQVVWHVVR